VLYSSVEIVLAAQDQEEGARQDAHQRVGDESGGANDYISQRSYIASSQDLRI